jgi:hypothetical protein
MERRLLKKIRLQTRKNHDMSYEEMNRRGYRGRKYRTILGFIAGILWSLLVCACSTTSAIPQGEQLFAGLDKIEYKNSDKSNYTAETQNEMESILASAPTGSLLGSSYYRTPFPIRLWLWNDFARSNNVVGQWLARTLGSVPKLMSNVNPQLRIQVAENQLRKFGYFDGKVMYKVKTMRNPKVAKLDYTVDMGHLWTIDSLRYIGFSALSDSLLRNHISEAVIKKGDPFNVPDLEAERERISRLFRNRGYYYYQSNLASYVADTLHNKGRVQLRFVLSDSLEEKTKKQWYIGNININLRKQFRDSLQNVRKHRNFIAHFNGKHSPLRTSVLSKGLKLQSGHLYNADAEYQTNKYFQSTGLFSNSSMTFTPRDTSASCDTLDMNMDMLFDKPYDFYVEANGKGKTTGLMGPELVLGFTKRNALRGGEKLNMNLHGSYEWQTGHKNEGSSSGVNSYEYGGDVSIVMPQLLTPQSFFRYFATGRHRHHHSQTSYVQTPTTTIKASMNILNRAGYFRRHVVSGELTYDWMPTVQSHFSFTPISISYEYMNSRTAKFDSLLSYNPYLQISMRDQMVPKMSFTYTYTSKPSYLSPITWSTTVSEAGNILSLGYLAAGQKWSEKNKKMFKNPYAQFLKVETDLVKYWRFSGYSTLVGHLAGGVACAYGNATEIPYYEQFYVGGANSVRAFNVRSIGPGKFVPQDSRYSYIDQTGNVKFLANLEYRPRLLGNLYGALFMDAGNVWNLKENDRQPGGEFEFGNFFKQLAVGTGVGIRYDMGMFVIRLDWGVGLHVPYYTGKSGFYNIPHFKDAQSIHLAVGYPF